MYCVALVPRSSCVLSEHEIEGDVREATAAEERDLSILGAQHLLRTPFRMGPYGRIITTVILSEAKNPSVSWEVVTCTRRMRLRPQREGILRSLVRFAHSVLRMTVCCT